MKEGKHEIIVRAEYYDDNTNKLTVDKSYDIYVENIDPTVSLTIDTEFEIINNQGWVDSENNVKLTANVKYAVSGNKSIKITVNDQDYVGQTEISDKEDGSKDIVFEVRGKDYMSGEDNSVTVVVTATSNIDNNASNSKEYNVDNRLPEIEKVTVSNARVIKSGVYSNGTINILVSAEDLDSGLDKLVLNYSKDGQAVSVENNTPKDNGDYEFILPFNKGDSLFSGNLEIIAYDNLGKTSDVIPKFGAGDKKEDNNFVMQEDRAPSISMPLPATDSKNNKNNQIWYNQNHNIIVRVEDNDSGIFKSEIRVNDQLIDPEQVSSKLLKVQKVENSRGDVKIIDYTISTSELEAYLSSNNSNVSISGYKITVTAEDNAQNGNMLNSNTFYIDSNPPQIDKFAFSVNTYDKKKETDKFTNEMGYQYFFNKKTTIRVMCSDEKGSSGLSKVTYRLVNFGQDGKVSGETSGEAVINSGVANIDLPDNFKGKIYARAFDNLENASKEVSTEAYVVDMDNPIVEYSKLATSDKKDAKGHKIYSDDITYTVSVKDIQSGIGRVVFTDFVNDAYERQELKIDTKKKYKVGDKLDNDWEIVSVDNNLITEIKKTVKLTQDGNDISSKVMAYDMSGNYTVKKSDVFTIDKTAPVISVTRTKGIKDNPEMYNASTKAVLTIIVEDNNFAPELIQTAINNSYTKAVPAVKFNKVNGTNKYQATINFPEGDFDVSVSGEDMAGNVADVNFEGKKTQMASVIFNVDESSPIVTTNFGDFSVKNPKTETNLFNEAKLATITVKEHNFDPELMELKVYQKTPGNGYTLVKDDESSYVMYSDKGWTDKGENSDIHTLTMNFAEDGIYKVQIAPKDMVGNEGKSEQTAVFEIDRTAPVVVSRNGIEAEAGKIKVVDVYDYDKKDQANPTVEFDDVNYDHLEYTITKFSTKYDSDKELEKVEGSTFSGKEINKVFELKDFKEDGVYSVDIKAYDKAGNVSDLVTDTYMKMVNSDVLAYIENSHPGVDGTVGSGWYSIEDEDGTISKRPDDFEDLDIAVFSRNNASTSVTLNDNDGNVTDTGLVADVSQVSYGVSLHRYTLKGDYFKNNYQEDTDATLYLTANSGNKKFELGQIHIDNIAPECDLPDYFHNWGWLAGFNPDPVEISGINEKIDPKTTTIYVDGKKAEYNYNSKNNTLSFDLKNGTHSIGVSLVDMAGNRYDIPEITNFSVGNARIYMGVGAGIALIMLFSALYFINKRKRQSV